MSTNKGTDITIKTKSLTSDDRLKDIFSGLSNKEEVATLLEEVYAVRLGEIISSGEYDNIKELEGLSQVAGLLRGSAQIT